MTSFRNLLAAVTALSLAACASGGGSPAANVTTAAPRPDPRVGLKAGLHNAAQATWNMRLVINVPSPAKFDSSTNSDLAFYKNYAIQGNYNGFQVWDISNPAHPTLKIGYYCPASQSDVSVFHNLLFVSGEGTGGRLDCTGQGVRDSVSTERLRGIRIFDITDIANPKYITNVQTCRGSHTHTVVTSPNDPANVYIYVSGSAPVRSPSELPGCVRQSPDSNPNSSLFRIEVIRVPLAAPQQAAIVGGARFLDSLAAPPQHGEAPEDIAAAKRVADSARAQGAIVVELFGTQRVLPSRFQTMLLDSVAKARGAPAGSPPTAADTQALRDSAQVIINRMFNANRRRTGPNQCHDITVYPAIGLAGGACGGYGILLDIRDPAHPRRLAAVSDSNFSYWHSATFNNDGTQILFTDEWGGGGGPKCRSFDKPEWGADALFTLDNGQMTFRSYYKLSAAQTENENCVAHNGSLIPVPGRDIFVQSWYQGGVSVFDWTDAAASQGDRVLRSRAGGFDEDGGRRDVVGVLVQRPHLQLRDRARARRARSAAERVAVGERDRGGQARAPRVLQHAGSAQAHMAGELRGGAGVCGSARALEGPESGADHGGPAGARSSGAGQRPGAAGCVDTARSVTRPGRGDVERQGEGAEARGGGGRAGERNGGGSGR